MKQYPIVDWFKSNGFTVAAVIWALFITYVVVICHGLNMEQEPQIIYETVTEFVEVDTEFVPTVAKTPLGFICARTRMYEELHQHFCIYGIVNTETDIFLTRCLFDCLRVRVLTGEMHQRYLTARFARTRHL